MKITIFLFCAVVVFTSCNNTPEKDKTTTNPVDKPSIEIIGKQAILTYPDFTAEVSYLTDSTLHWKSKNGEGKVAEGHEKVSYKRLNKTQFFLNWIEQDGVTVSQVIDPEQKKATSYVSFPDENSKRGNRTAMFIEGVFEFK